LSQNWAVEHAQKWALDMKPIVVVVIETNGTVLAGPEFPLDVEQAT